MDPLSFTASLIAVVAAATQISKALSRLRAFGKVPDQICSLKNEVTDLEVVLRQLGHRLHQDGLPPTSLEHESLSQILERTKGELGTIALRVERLATAFSKQNKTKIISCSAIWLKERSKFEQSQKDIKCLRETLSLMFDVSHSCDMENLLLELRQVTIISAASERAVSSRMEEQYRSLETRLDAIGEMLLNGQEADEKTLIGRSTTDLSDQDPHTSSVLRVCASRSSSCRHWCPCSCHIKTKYKAKAPGFMEALLGKMFLGYSGVPVLSKKCDFVGCRDQQSPTATMEYWFPWWFVSMNMQLHFKYIANVGPQFQISMVRRVPDTSQSVVFAQQGNIDGLKFLFTQGLASPRDVSDSRGFSLMRWALYAGMHRHETVQFLISQGAPVDEITYEHVWDFVFRGKCNDSQRQQLRCITDNAGGNWFEEQNFPLIHRTVLEMSTKSLATELDENPTSVYLTDAQGRTALDWATARAQLQDIRLLLSYGADPNSMDIAGRTTVLHAVDSHNAECLQLILEAGGHPDPKMPKGVFRSSPLTASGHGGLLTMVSLLLEFGANPNACNPEGFTALHSVASAKEQHSAACAFVLLQFGADPIAASKNGRTPLSVAIMHHNHAVLRLFVDHYHEYMTKIKAKVVQLLSTIAGLADVQSMVILCASRRVRQSLDLSPASVTSCRETLASRHDHSEKLTEAFEELLLQCQDDQQNDCCSYDSDDSLVESELFVSAKSSFHFELASAVAELGMKQHDVVAEQPTMPNLDNAIGLLV